MDFRLLNLRSAEVTRRLRDGELDLGLVRQDAVGTSLRKRPFVRMGFALFIPKRLAPVSEKAADWKKLLSEPLVGLEGEGAFQEKIADWAESQSVRLTVKLVCPSFSLVAEAMRTAHLCGVLPEAASSEMKDAGFTVLKPPAFRLLDRQISIVWSPRTETVRPVLSRCMDAISKLTS